MVGRLDCGYLLTPTGQLNIAELICLIGALISVGFTSRLYCELVDNLQYIYPQLNTLLVRSLFQSFALFCFTITLVILIIHISGIRFSGRNYYYINQLCLMFNIFMGLMMITIGICAAFWEDKLRRTPDIIQRGYFVDRYQYIYGEITHPRPGAAAAAAILGILAGILFITEAFTRPMLNTSTTHSPDYFTKPIVSYRAPIKNINDERIIPIERTVTSYLPSRF
ncbi:unnamed protein product [Rotaria sordida]|uniref:Uncharacterized protein n=1 Tax=Rotaria sordida TaxID=392033 RepID=A0A814TCP9_9BILA|nr:unnamed protein product [Rotaria sordida]CAF1159042.1 unnamed protein product [Rotaria sordida]CAF3953299.1 unnamed protein product [Rotaria sordida]CAF4142385.1 unnamed protein product [Rotaria sordida]